MTYEERQFALVVKGIMAEELRPLWDEIKEMRRELALINTEARLDESALAARREYCHAKHEQVDRDLGEIRAAIAEGDKTSSQSGQRMFVTWKEKWSWLWVAVAATLLLLVEVLADKVISLMDAAL